MSVSNEPKKIILDLLGEEIWQYAVVASSDFQIEEGVREACKQNYCGSYGKSWSCPPGAGELSDIAKEFASYEKGFVFTTKADLEDSFDYEGMTAASVRHRDLTRSLVPLCNENGWLLLGPGGCDICEKCTYPDAPCRFPEKRIRSLEGSGVNVMALSRAAGINYINGSDTVTYFTAILYR